MATSSYSPRSSTFNSTWVKRPHPAAAEENSANPSTLNSFSIKVKVPCAFRPPEKHPVSWLPLSLEKRLQVLAGSTNSMPKKLENRKN
jgi:hypothetical protein